MDHICAFRRLHVGLMLVAIVVGTANEARIDGHASRGNLGKLPTLRAYQIKKS
jgi:hypothetical protein